MTHTAGLSGRIPSIRKPLPPRTTSYRGRRAHRNRSLRVTGPMAEFKFRGKTVHVLGTAHVSRRSVEDVMHYIADEKPDVVCVELCPARYRSILEKEKWRKLDIVQVIRNRKVYLLMSSLILSAFQKKMGDQNGVKPGEEMITAIELARRNDLKLELVDRDIQITLKRAWQTMGYFTKMMMFSEMVSSLLVRPDIEAEDIEKMKHKDVLDDMFDAMPIRFRKVQNVIITERDQYLAQKIRLAAEQNKSARRIFAVVGAGHLPGIKRYFYSQKNLKAMETVKEKSKILAVLKFFAPVLILLGLLYWFSDTSNLNAVMKSLLAWTVIKAGISGFAALIMLAHPLGILGAALTAPISNFNPVLKPGWVAAYLEAKFRKPSVADFENIASDSESIRGFFSNRVIRIFSALMLPQLGSSLATAVALWYIRHMANS